jgi:hypothetical protein
MSTLTNSTTPVTVNSGTSTNISTSSTGTGTVGNDVQQVSTNQGMSTLLELEREFACVRCNKKTNMLQNIGSNECLWIHSHSKPDWKSLKDKRCCKCGKNPAEHYGCIVGDHVNSLDQTYMIVPTHIIAEKRLTHSFKDRIISTASDRSSFKISLLALQK